MAFQRARFVQRTLAAITQPAPTSCCEHNYARWGVWEIVSRRFETVCRASDAL